MIRRTKDFSAILTEPHFTSINRNYFLNRVYDENVTDEVEEDEKQKDAKAAKSTDTKF